MMAENGDAGKENGMKTLLISACLLGVRCRYDGGSKPQPGVEELAGRYRLIPVCPEQLGGLPTPREPSERQGERVVMKSGRDVTAEYRRGAEEALRLAELFDCGTAIHDGSFAGGLAPGDGVTTEVLKAHGIRVLGESRVGEL